MADSSQGSASFGAQANALLRKNLTFQKRNIKTNIRLILFPLILCILLVLLQNLISSQLNKPAYTCGCKTIDKGNGQSERVCGIEYSDETQAAFCPIPRPQEWPSVLQVPSPYSRAVSTDSITDLPKSSCRSKESCPATFLFTGQNRTFGESLSGKVFTNSIYYNPLDISYSLAKNVLGSDTLPDAMNFLDPAFVQSYDPLYYLQSKCTTNSTMIVPIRFGVNTVAKEIRCVEGLLVRRDNSAEINAELYKGYHNGNEMMGAYDFLNSNLNNFNVNVWYNATYKHDRGNGPIKLSRVPRAVNLISNTYLQLLRGPSMEMLLEFVKEMPKSQTRLSLDFASLLGPLFFTWVILQLFPVILTSLVYEKQQRLRIMMKMHGLGDGPYWMITYGYFLLISAAYMLCFVIFGSVIGLKFFTVNAYSIQFVFYFVYINLQIAFAFLIAAMFSNVKTATVIGYIMVFSSGLLGGFLFSYFVQDESFPRVWIIVMELYPGFSLYRGLFEFSQYAVMSSQTGTRGMQWVDLSNSDNGIRDLFMIMFVEWIVLLFVAYYIDQVISSGSGVGRSPLFFLERFHKKSKSSLSRKLSLEKQGSEVLVELDKPDIAEEKGKVGQLLLEPSSHAIVCDNLQKVYPRRDGNPEKYAVRGMSLALPRGECFGMLGPNGAGKTSFINMMIGLIKPTSGAAYVNGLDIRAQMNEIYTSMGVCPQHDLLWEPLTGREHLLFYGRLKNLKGSDLTQAVEQSLRSVNLNGVADKKAGKYSGGMKRRLSVAISLIGDPKVVYMDEPSTGLDPASRHSLWNVVKRAKQNRAIILTTHSMEEAEHLCDRLGIFVDGSLQCIGNPKELKGRYGGSYVFTITTSSDNEEQVDNLVRNLSPNATKVYHLSGTQKFELPKQDIKIADVFQAVEKAKGKFTVYAWGLADTTLEDVFIKVARGAQSSNELA